MVIPFFFFFFYKTIGIPFYHIIDILHNAVLQIFIIIRGPQRGLKWTVCELKTYFFAEAAAFMQRR